MVSSENKKALVKKPGTLLRPHRDKRSLPSRLITNITQKEVLWFDKFIKCTLDNIKRS